MQEASCHTQLTSILIIVGYRSSSAGLTLQERTYTHQGLQEAYCRTVYARQLLSVMFPWLQEQYRKYLTLQDAEVLALSTLKQVMEEKVSRGVFLGCPLIQPAAAPALPGRLDM